MNVLNGQPKCMSFLREEDDGMGVWLVGECLGVEEIVDDDERASSFDS